MNAAAERKIDVRFFFFGRSGKITFLVVAST